MSQTSNDSVMLGAKFFEAVQAAETAQIAEVRELEDRANALLDAAQKTGSSHSGSNFGSHHDLYYGDFEQPPLGDAFSAEWGLIHGIPSNWLQRRTEDVRERIEGIASVRFSELQGQENRLLGGAKSLWDSILLELGTMLTEDTKRGAGFEALEALDWKDNDHKVYCTMLLESFPRSTRDSAAFHQGRFLPAHTCYEATSHQVLAHCEAIRNFWRTSKLVLRRIQSAGTATAASAGTGTRGLESIRNTCRRFHRIVLQLARRREPRSPLSVADEYDVQYLLHALLKLHFDDVRPEEPTPSVGGAGARMDFLVEEEELAVEAKMASSRLRDKDLFNEVTQDVARYRKHPRCRTLICLIYDPQNQVKNAVGLMKDVTDLSTDRLYVEAFVVPTP